MPPRSARRLPDQAIASSPGRRGHAGGHPDNAGPRGVISDLHRHLQRWCSRRRPYGRTTRPITVRPSTMTSIHQHDHYGILGAAFNPDIRAAACFYATDIHKHGLGQGMNDDTLERVGEIGGELLMIWGPKIRIFRVRAVSASTRRSKMPEPASRGWR